jgi:hydroxymethylpyrimidine/phosphomethylpyrimidine kinase
MTNIFPRAENISEKHGMQCVLSSALAHYLLIVQNLESAFKNVKYNTEAFLNSNGSFLGKHRYPKIKN